MPPPARDAARPADLVAAARAAGDDPRLLLVRSSLPFGDDLTRVGLFSTAGALTPLADALVRAADLPELDAALRELGPVATGGWDAFYATAWRWVWSVDASEVRLWDRADNALAAVATPGALTVRWLRLTDVRQIDLTIDPTWVHRSLRALRDDNAPVDLVSVEDDAPMADPTYDATLLDLDTTWLADLGAALAAALRVPFRA